MAESLQLSTAECERLLREGVVARVAVCTPDGPHVVPVNYRVLEDSLVFRTSPYSVLGTYGRDAVLAVEVDSIDSELEVGWSVHARGRATVVTDPDEVVDIRRAWTAEPWAAGVRTLYVRLCWAELTGRRLAPVSLSSHA